MHLIMDFQVLVTDQLNFLILLHHVDYQRSDDHCVAGKDEKGPKLCEKQSCTDLLG